MSDRKEKLFFVGVKGLMVNEHNQMLVLKADINEHRMNTEEYWDIPGGRIEHGDSEESTLEKEISEELGIKIGKQCIYVATVISNHEIPLHEGGVAGLVLRIWQVPYHDELITLSDEHTDFEWVSFTEAAQRLRHKYPDDFCDQIAQRDNS